MAKSRFGFLNILKLLQFIFVAQCCSASICIFGYASQECHEFVTSSEIKSPVFKSMQRLSKLDPDLFQQLIQDPDLNHEKIYLALKTKAWHIMPFGMINWKSDFFISDDLKDLWIENFGEIYNIEDLNSKNLIIFYANSLQSIYSQTLGLILHDRALTLFDSFGFQDKSFKKRMPSALGKLLGFDLRRSHVDPTTASTALASDQYLKIKWASVYLAYQDCKTTLESNDKGSIKLSASEFHELKNKYQLSDFDLQVLQWVIADQSLKPSEELCCKNSAGCIFCPNNLGFKKPR